MVRWSRVLSGAVVAALGAVIVGGAAAAGPTVTVRPGEAVWFLVEGAPPGSCAGRDDRVRAGRVTAEELEVVYEAVFATDCAAPPSPKTPVARNLVVEGLGAGTYNLIITGGVALRAEAVRTVSIAPTGGEALEVPIVDARTTSDKCVGYTAADTPENAIVLFATDRATVAGRCLEEGRRGPYFRATWASAPKGVTLFVTPPLKPGPMLYGEAASMGPPSRLLGLKGGPPAVPLRPGDLRGTAEPVVDLGAMGAGAVGGSGGASAVRTSVVAGITVSITGELWLGDKRKIWRPDVPAAEGAIHLYVDNTSAFVQTVKVMRAWVVDATGWARKASIVPKHPPTTALKPGDRISVGLGLKKLPVMTPGSAWTLRVDMVAAGVLHRLESGPVTVGAFR